MTSLSVSQSNWPEIIPLIKEFPDQSPYPVDALGDILGPLARTIQSIQRSPLDLCCQSVLAATNLACAGLYDIEVDGRIYPNVDFFTTVALSGERKDGADSIALRPHRQHQKNLRERFNIDFEIFQKELAAYEADKKKLAREEDKTKLRDLKSPCSPPPPILEVSDPTIEGIQRLFAEGLSRLGLFTTEAGVFLGGWSMQNSQIIRTAAALSKFWDGKPISIARGTTGSHTLAGRRLALHLGVQPEIAIGFLGSRELENQGLLARFLPAWVTSTIGSRQYNNVNPCSDSAYLHYERVIGGLLKKNLPLSQERPGELDPPRRKLSPAAKALWIQFHDALDKDSKIGHKLHLIQPFACKGAEHSIRLAGILCSVATDDNEEISGNIMRDAITLVSWYVKEWLRIKEACSEDNTSDAQLLLKWLKERKVNSFISKDVYQKGPKPLRSAGIAHGAIDELVAHNIIREATFQDPGRNGEMKMYNGFELNPDA